MYDKLVMIKVIQWTNRKRKRRIISIQRIYAGEFITILNLLSFWSHWMSEWRKENLKAFLFFLKIISMSWECVCVMRYCANPPNWMDTYQKVKYKNEKKAEKKNEKNLRIMNSELNDLWNVEISNISEVNVSVFHSHSRSDYHCLYSTEKRNLLMALALRKRFHIFRFVKLQVIICQALRIVAHW